MTTVEDLTPEDRAMVQELWMRQHLARIRAAMGSGRRKGDGVPRETPERVAA